MAQIRKALAAAIAAGAAALTAGVAQPGGLTTQSWEIVIGAVLLAGLGVFFIPNAPPTPTVVGTPGK
jgi:uncharacterized NAD-dependent epimerase/dehydratase family protein